MAKYALGLEWRYASAAAATAPALSPKLPSHDSLLRLQEQLAQGHVRGIHLQLDLMAAEDCADFVERARALAQRFELPAMTALVARALQDQGLHERLH